MRPQEVVILVHGTFAGDKSDDGMRWWQRGSDFWKKLSRALPPHLKLLEDAPLFHWSDDFDSKYETWKGKNHQLYRHVASQELLVYLRQFEDEKTPYHVIAHSHGGSVLWSALRLADFQQSGLAGLSRKNLSGKSDQGPPLKYLRSCITVGTPYIRFEDVRNPLASLLTVEIGAFLIQMVLPLILTVTTAYFFGFYALFALLAWLVLIPFVESKTMPIKFSAMQARDEVIASHYADRWLTVWSEADEVLNLLRGALRLPRRKSRLSPSLPFVPPRESNWVVTLLFLNQYLYPYLFDKLILPVLDKIARNRFAASVLGMSYFRRVVEISPWPCRRIGKAKNLAEGPEQFLKTAADEQLATAAPRVRDALTLFGAGESIERILAGMFGASQGELVHTSYLDSDIVFDAIVDHLAGG